MDKLWLVGELEHLRRHAVRSATSLHTDEDDKDKRWVEYAILALEAQSLRRECQEKLGPITEYDWCLVKVAMSLKQLAYETVSSDYALLKEIDDLTDSVLEKALGTDLSDCSACKDDKAVVE